jgi:hypothetical protein
LLQATPDTGRTRWIGAGDRGGEGSRRAFSGRELEEEEDRAAARRLLRDVLQKTGNIAAVMNTMGHSDVKTAMVYQHPELNVVREAINARALAENSGHVLGHRSERPN